MIFNPKLNGFLSDQNSSILHVFFVETYTTVKSDEVNTAKVPRFQTDQICGFKLAPDFSHVKNTKKKKVKAKYLFTSSSMPSFSLSWRNWSRAYLMYMNTGLIWR